MTPLRYLTLILFSITVTLQISYSMDIKTLVFFGSLLSIVFCLFDLKIKKPSFGLIFILVTAGGLIGNLVLEEFYTPGHWVFHSKVFSGGLLAFLIYFYWLISMVNLKTRISPFEKNLQILMLLGLFLLLITPSTKDEMILTLKDIEIPFLKVFGLILTVFIMISFNQKKFPKKNILALIILLIFTPFVFFLLNSLQDPLINFFTSISINYEGNASTGFSPYQSLSSKLMLHPSKKPVFRVRAEKGFTPYLVGNRLFEFNSEKLSWSNSLGENIKYKKSKHKTDRQKEIYKIKNSNKSQRAKVKQYKMYIKNLKYDNSIFMPPDVFLLSGNIKTLIKDKQNVFKAVFDRKSDREWQVISSINPKPDEVKNEYLKLPSFWDEKLNSKSLSLSGKNSKESVNNIVDYFKKRKYSLNVDFDRKKPFHDFFLNEKPAFCFWYATAAAFVLRANKIPSRIVGGYLINEHLGSNVWIVRERDAHAWVEWMDKDRFWHTMDPTPLSIEAYFDNYESVFLSRWYHLFVTKLDELFEGLLSERSNELTIILLSGFILIILFIREYMRIEVKDKKNLNYSKEWENIWIRFLKSVNIENNPSWTVYDYRKHLPVSFNEEKKRLIISFLDIYENNRFSYDNESSKKEAASIIKMIKLK